MAHRPEPLLWWRIGGASVTEYDAVQIRPVDDPATR